MEDKDLDKYLEKIKKEIPVNEILKKKMRKSFACNKKSRWVRRSFTAAAVIVLICVSIIAPDNLIPKKVNAESLNISNQISYIETATEEGIGVNEYKGIQYITMGQKGIYAYDKGQFNRIYDGEVSSAKLSSNGRRFLIAFNGTISIYDIDTKIKNEILKGDNQSIYYEEPSWSKDGKSILYTKKVVEAQQSHGFTVKETAIYEMDLSIMESRKITDGSYASYINNMNKIVFEKNNKIIVRDLKNQQEKVADEGRFPDVSPDGKYIAYVKMENTSRKLNENASVLYSMPNVWTVNTNDFSSKKPVTFNFEKQYINIDEWVKGLKNTDVPQQLVISGIYDYYNPSWSSDSKSLFVIKFLTTEGKANRKIMKIDFSADKPGGIYIVKKFAQALILRDDDYARSLMKTPPEILTISNPHPVGYNILSEGRDNNGNYVEAEILWQYTGNPYFQKEKSKYYIEEENNKNIISSVKSIENIELSYKNGAVYITIKDNKEDVIFSEKDISSKYYDAGTSRVVSITSNNRNDMIVFTTLSGEGESTLLRVITYDRKNGDFKLIDTIRSEDDLQVIGTSDLTLDSTGRYAASNVIFGRGENFVRKLMVFDLSNGRKVNISDMLGSGIQSAGVNFWDGENLVFTVQKNEESVKYIYIPSKNELENF